MNVTDFILSGSLAMIMVAGVSARPISQSSPSAKTVDVGDVNKVALKMPLLSYPRDAWKAGIHGVVKVRVWINMRGDVVRAMAVSGHRMLRGTSLRGAQQSKFPPNLGNCDTCRYATGVLTYTFVKQDPPSKND